MTQLTFPPTGLPPRGRPTIHVVVSCTSTKRQRPASNLMARNLPAVPVQQRAREWLRRLKGVETADWEATELYAGDHWSAAARLPEVGARQGYATELWVLSAGYGLIPGHQRIASYAATFSSSSPDSVGSRGETLTWWNIVSAESSLAPGQPRSLTALATANPSARIMIVAAPSYLQPIGVDVIEAARHLNSDEQLMVVSAGARSSTSALTAFLVPVDSRLSQVVGGSRISLNARTAALVLKSAGQSDFTRSAASEFLSSRLAPLSPAVVHNRTAMTDDEVMAYVQDRLTVDPSLSATRLLREFRNGGRACEQHRFHDLVRAVRESHV